MTRIEIHIDELVLHGFSPHHRALIGDAVEAALAHAVEPQGSWATDASAQHLDAGSVNVPRNAPPSVLGNAIAAAVTSAISRVR